MNSPPKIVLTGGPGGGKTSFLRDIRLRDPRAEVFVLIPEAATVFIQAGHLPGTKEFQCGVVALQRNLEDHLGSLSRPGQVLVCDRSTVDSLAYWLKIGGTEAEFEEATGLSLPEHRDRYQGCLLLRTAALGAERHYRRILDGARVETPEEAARIDSLCERVWKDHPLFAAIENEPGGWEKKSEKAWESLTNWVEQVTMRPPDRRVG